jgi:hypothetical protein
MATIKSKQGIDVRFTEDAELAFKKFVEVICELFQRSDMDVVMGRQRGRDVFD